MESILKRLAQGWYRLSASKKLLPYEGQLLDAWRNSLSKEGQRVLDAQLEAVSMVQHQAGGAKVCFYYCEEQDMPLFKPNQPDLHAATVLLQSEETLETMRVKIFVHRGKLFSIEFPKRPSRYMQQHHMRAQTLRVGKIETHVNLT